MNLTTQFTIQKNDLSSIDDISVLWKKLYSYHHFLRYEVKIFPTDSDWIRRRNKLINKSNELAVITAYDADNLIGYLVASVCSSDKTIGEIESLYVLEENRGEGVGEALMREGMNWLNCKGVFTQKIAVGFENEKVIEFYRKLGYFPKSIVLEKRS